MKTHPISIAQAAQAAWSFSKFGLSDKEEAEIVAAQLRRVALVIPVAIPLVLTAIALVVLAIIEINAAAPDIWLLGSWFRRKSAMDRLDVDRPIAWRCGTFYGVGWTARDCRDGPCLC